MMMRMVQKQDRPESTRVLCIRSLRAGTAPAQARALVHTQVGLGYGTTLPVTLPHPERSEVMRGRQVEQRVEGASEVRGGISNQTSSNYWGSSIGGHDCSSDRCPTSPGFTRKVRRQSEKQR